MADWPISAADMVLLPVTILATFEGARRISQRRTRAAILLLAVGVLLSGLRATAGLIIGSMGSDIEAHRTHVIAELAPNWGAELSPYERQKSSLAYAAVAFKETGRSLEYFDQSGDKKRFVPTPEQLREREFNIEVFQRMEDTSAQAENLGIAAVVSSVIAIAAGLVVGKRYPG